MFLPETIGKNILLRPYQPSDICSWHKWDLDEEVQRYLPEPKNVPVSDKEQLKYLAECEQDQEGIYWSVVDKASDKLIGTVSITEINQHHGAGELGIVIGEKDYRGKGVAREALELAIQQAVLALKLRRVSAEFEEGNIGMQKVLENAGFVQEALLRDSRMKNSQPINTMRYFRLLN